MSQNAELKNYQKNLDTDLENKRRFVNAENEADHDSDSEVESDTENGQECRLSLAPRRSKGKTPSIDMVLMEQLMNLNKDYLKSQKKIFKLQSEIDVEDVKTRYVKLDLNNSEVKNEELKESVHNLSRKLLYSQAENWLSRTVFLVFVLWVVVTSVTKHFSPLVHTT